ncbi:uncharacterized protein LOC108622737 [Ceratina calcarata]|uniref:Uncharacterized protein LOC108622737 n=1 Tax=Ceratina calcarata TaxID=156304 RepID=A0AAJ7N3T0_9HYME|nr:uncharacterized protein LOC108622737 [Ceratina calcarata]XP_017876303.1 uncharacterized protein LOC108622737 [Ceratina calcarata]XP_017876304.1 uncharacterized protein LOC108622737 [Ceratina calcarata]
MEDDRPPRDTCFGAGSVAGAVIGTFLTTILLLLAAAILYRQWRRHKGKHLVLVTDPEIVEEAYAFDNPCFKDVTTSSHERPVVSSTPGNTPGKDSARWSTSWTSLGLVSVNRDKRKTLDDSCLGPKATRINVVSLKSRDFTGLGFNICGNMREGIFVKDLLHRGPASESGRIHPGDRIASVKISFRNMVYEDALTILSYASPYDVKLEVESGVTGSKPTTLLKKTVGPSAARICHPLYRSQSIPELSQSKSVAKRLFIVDPNESANSNYSTMNSTMKSSRSISGNQYHEKAQDESKSTNHHKFGIKVLPSLDGTVHRIENQNEHNTNLERRHSKKLEKHTEKQYLSNVVNKTSALDEKKEEVQRQQASFQNKRISKEKNSFEIHDVTPSDATDKGKVTDVSSIQMPTEVHNAAMAARRNRKNSSELLNQKSIETIEAEDLKSQQKNKRKAPLPPKSANQDPDISLKKNSNEDKISTISDYTESLSEYIKNVREDENLDDSISKQKLSTTMGTLRIDRQSESDTDSEIQNSFTTIELNSADITIHRTPVPETNDDDDDGDDVYRKAASLGDLSKYECKTSTTLERAQSLDMTTETGTKKRKAPLPPEDITESTEDLTKLDQMDTFDRRLLKKSNEWGNLEDVWRKGHDLDDKPRKKVRKRSSGSLERSKSSIEIKLKDEESKSKEDENTTSIELYNLPLSKRLTEDFIRTERMFNPDEDNSLIRIVNDGNTVKSPTLEELEWQFKTEVSLPEELNKDDVGLEGEISDEDEKAGKKDFGKALKYFETYSEKLDSTKPISYAGRRMVVEEPMTKVTVKKGCPACEENCNRHETCKKKSFPNKRSSTPIPLQEYSSNLLENDDSITVNDEEPCSMSPSQESMMIDKGREDKSERSSIDSKNRRIIEVPLNQRITRQDDEDEDEYEFESGVTISNKNLFDHRHNINNVSVSSGENSEDSGLVGESMDYNPQDFDSRPPLPVTPMPPKMTYITEIKLSPKRGKLEEDEKSSERISETKRQTEKNASNGKTASSKKPPVPPRRTDIAKSGKKGANEKQITYVSEYKSNESNEKDNSSDVSQEIKHLET